MNSTENTDSQNQNTQDLPPLPDIDTNTPGDPTASAPATTGDVWQMVLCKVGAAGTMLLGRADEVAGEIAYITPEDGGPFTPLPYMTYATGEAAVDAGRIAFAACNALNAQPPVAYSMGQQDGGKGKKKCGKVIQSGGNKIDERTAKILNRHFNKNLNSRDWCRLLEQLKKENGLDNDYHGSITKDGEYLDKSGNSLGNIGDYFP